MSSDLSSSPGGPAHEASSPPQSQVFPSFLFAVHELSVDGEVEPILQNGHWYPPRRASVFKPSKPSKMYRWCSGLVTKDTECVYRKGAWYARDRRTELTTYKTKSVFWCGKRVGFVTAEVDASLTDLEYEEPPLHCWRDLQFSSDPHEPGISRIINAGEPCLAGTGADWIQSLGLGSYDEGESDPPLPAATGLGGDIPTLIAIMAFSCRAKDMEDMFITDMAWHECQWRKHNRKSGRAKERGLVVNVYLDPDNPRDSTPDWLSYLEYNQILLQ